jgi:hypothetical protein
MGNLIQTTTKKIKKQNSSKLSKGNKREKNEKDGEYHISFHLPFSHQILALSTIKKDCLYDFITVFSMLNLSLQH